MHSLSFYKGKKVFVTGDTGFKGTWLCRILLSAGADVAGFALESPTSPSLFELTQTKNNIHHTTGDIRNSKSVQNAVSDFQPDIVFHLAAQPLVRLSYEKPVMTFETNVMGTVHILEAVRCCPSVKSFVNITTDKVYENKEWHWGYRENENLCGYDPYSNSKSCSELVTASYRNSFFSTVDSAAISTARSGNVIGGGDYAKDRIIPDCIRAAHAHKIICIRNPYSTRPYQHVLECLNGYLLLAQKQYEDKQQFAGSYNFGPDDESCVTTGQLADLFCSAWGAEAQWKQESETNPPHEANFLKLDCSKSKAVLGWKPHWNIQTAIAKIAEWEHSVASGIAAADITNKQIAEYFETEK